MPDPQPRQQLRAVDIKTEGDMLAARIVGSVIESNRAQVILDAVTRAMDGLGSDLRFMVIDFDEVTFINSTGIGACLQLATKAKAGGAVPIAYRPTEDVTEIFTRCKVDSVFRMVQTTDELARILGD
ncbi:MAG: STAS domain-containing protein [Planctomycetota bacterium]|jgi:anti-anti-sigma factor